VRLIRSRSWPFSKSIRCITSFIALLCFFVSSSTGTRLQRQITILIVP
jgi:hypothetical protein